MAVPDKWLRSLSLICGHASVFCRITSKLYGFQFLCGHFSGEKKIELTFWQNRHYADDEI